MQPNRRKQLRVEGCILCSQFERGLLCELLRVLKGGGGCSSVVWVWGAMAGSSLMKRFEVGWGGWCGVGNGKGIGPKMVAINWVLWE